MSVQELLNLFFLLLPLIGMLALYLSTNSYLVRTSSFPLNSFSDRQPAASKATQLRHQRHTAMVLMFFIALMFGLGLFQMNHLNYVLKDTLAILVVISYAAMVLVAIIYLLLCIRKIKLLQLMCEAEQNMALLLAETKANYQLFNDVPLSKQHVIPHLLLGKSGLFLINVLVQGQPLFKKNKADIRARYMDGVFYFPNGSNKKIIKQTQALAVNLSAKLEKQFGKVLLKTILVVPGWYLEKTGQAGVIILPIKQTAAFINSFADKPTLEDFQLEKIQSYLSQLKAL